MHSHDRTMIASMGFADPDKKEPLHELACQFLIQRAVAEKIGAMTRPDRVRFSFEQKAESQIHHCPTAAELHKRWPSVGGYRGSTVSVCRSASYEFDRTILRRALTESPISKGEGKYRTTVGFADVSLYFEWTYIFAGASEAKGNCCHCEWSPPPDEWLGDTPDKTVVHPGWDADIEVKIAKIPVSDIIRQIGLYREYKRETRWFVVTPWAINPHEKKALGDQRITHIRLGDGFEQFCREAKSLPAAESGLVL